MGTHCVWCTGSGLSHEEQEELVRQINRRASRDSTLLERSVSNSSSASQRFDDLATAKAVRPEHSYPDSPKVGSGMSKEDQDEMVRSINRRASKEAIMMHPPPNNASSKFNRPQDVESVKHTRPTEQFPDDI